MILTTIEELRFHSPAHAFDSIDGLVGFIDNSEHDFLEDKLGTPLYVRLQQWYDANQHQMSLVSAPAVGDSQLSPFNRLCLLAQRCVAFDALGRSIGMQVVSVNNSGVNQMVADDYEKPSEKNIETYRNTCTTEAHAALNQLLRQLELWCRAASDVSDVRGQTPGSPQTSDVRGQTPGSPQTNDAESARDLSPDIAERPTSNDAAAIERPTSNDDIAAELREIVELWRQSRYYYTAAQLLLPSCVVLQQYLNIYDSREKFIQLLPDLDFIQEEILAPAVGEDFMDYLVNYTGDSKLLHRIVHKLRKTMACMLEGRTSVLRVTKERKVVAHDEGVRLLGQLREYCQQHQPDILTALGDDHADVYRHSPMYVEPPAPSPDGHHQHHHCGCDAREFNPDDAALHVTMPLL